MLKSRPLILIGAIALLFGCASAPAPVTPTENQTLQSAAVETAPLDYEDYGNILSTYVNDRGLVDYPALQANPQALKDFVAKIGAVAPASYAAWSESDKIAFLINAYNAITLQSIIEQDPLKKSIRDIPGVWKLKTHTVIGEAKTLDNIEHQILRQEFKEPRIHAALVCAAISCPPLRREPYTGAQLDAQLDDQVNQWLAGPHGLSIDRAQNRVAISSIFKWFGEDWEKSYGIEGKFTGNGKERAVLNFISNYVSPEDREYLAQGQYKLDYLEYDWALNRQ